ncbi:MAG: two-component regulator propeller domain-containing protein [Bacteroidales bacterium]
MSHRANLLIVSVLFLSPLVFGQKLHFRNYTIKEGLPQNTVANIIQDSKGYLWLATQVGAARFDGKNFQNFSTAQGLPDNSVNQLFEDSQGRIWIATNGGVASFYRNKLKSFTKQQGLLDNTVLKLSEDAEGNIWCVTTAGISIIGRDTVIRNITLADQLPSLVIQDVMKDSKGRMWIGTQSGAACFLGGKLTPITEDLAYLVGGRRENTVRDIAEGADGLIWIATQGGGIFVFKDYKLVKKYTRQDGLGDNTILSLYRDSKGNIWCSQYQGGISCFDGKKFTRYASQIIGNDAVLEIIEDRKGQIWCQTFNSGVIFGKPGELRMVNTGNNLINDQVQDLFTDTFGNVWIGTLGGVSMFGKGIFELYTTTEGLPDNNILSVECLADGSVMVGNYNSLTWFRDFSKPKVFNDAKILSLFQDKEQKIWTGYWASLNFYNGFSFNKINLPKGDRLYDLDNGILSIADAPGDSLWLSTENGAFIFDKSSRKYRFEAAIEPIQVRNIWHSKDNVTWFATVNGVYIKSPSGTLHFTTDNGLPALVCTGITTDEHGKIWVGTEGGLAQFRDSSGIIRLEKVYTRDQGLISNTIFSLVYSGNGNLWLGSEKGLNRLNVITGEIMYYGVSDGFTPLENNTNSVAIAPSGKIWFGTVSGLVSYNPSSDSISKTPPFTYITKLRFQDNSFRLAEYCDSIDSGTNLPAGLKLPYSNNTFTFECIGIHLTIPEKVKYQYFLEGYDDNWSEPTSQTSYECKKLPNGHYTFFVRAANNDGIWVSEPVAFSFQVKPPFYRTIWAYMFYVLLVVFILFSYVRYRERKLQHDKKVLEDEVKRRTAEIARQKEEIEHINDELREQQQEILAQRDEIERQRDIATQQRDQIGFQKKEITDSIHYAKRIQNAILPSDELARQILPEHFILFRPRDIVSGDFYWMARKGEKLVVTAADCTGHGVPGAFMSMLGVSLLNEIVNKEDVFVASEILNNLRHNVKVTLSQTGKENEAKDGMDIALVVYDFDTKMLQYAGANNPFYLVRNGELIEYKADGMPIGIYVGEEKFFTNNEIQLQSGDSCYIFSDGFADQFGGPAGGKFKTKPFKRLVTQEAPKPMSEQKLLFEKALEDWKGSLDQVDDILVIGFRVP